MKLLIVLSFAAMAFAQTTSRTGTLGGVIGPAPGAQIVSPGWTFASSSGAISGGTVTGAPYSAEEVTEQIQTLADGTHISQPAPKVKYYRDSQGRTRTERTFPLPAGAFAAGVDAPTLIEIFDPVSGARYTLEPRTHTARKISFPAPTAAASAPAKFRNCFCDPGRSHLAGVRSRATCFRIGRAGASPAAFSRVSRNADNRRCPG